LNCRHPVSRRRSCRCCARACCVIVLLAVVAVAWTIRIILSVAIFLSIDECASLSVSIRLRVAVLSIVSGRTRVEILRLSRANCR
jgi:hypothetical protein